MKYLLSILIFGLSLATSLDVLQYDDNSPEWIVYEGSYRAVQFRTEDFLPNSVNFLLVEVEYVFYHHNTRPWTNNMFFSEVWIGNYLNPDSMLVQKSFNAYTPMHTMKTIIHSINPPIEVSNVFWCIINTEPYSNDGSPTNLADYEMSSFGHRSFYSNDFNTWTGWLNTSKTGDFIIRASGYLVGESLNAVTWGTIKSLF